MSASCQPTFNSPCIDSATIINGGGQIVEQIDGTVSVWVKGDNGLYPYTNINTKPCCELLGYIFDVENQQCLWDDSISCDTCELRIAVNPNGNDGDYFYFNSGDTCNLDISLDYLFKFDCSVLQSGETVNQEALDILDQISDLTDKLEDTKLDCAELSGQCAEYTAIYEAMCYTIVVSQHTLEEELSNDSGSIYSRLHLQDSFETVCCLTEAGLLRWQSILGDIKYNAWLTNNGCSTNYYTNEQATLIFTEGNELAAQNNTVNPYFSQTNQSICDKQIAYSEMVEVCTEYQNCLREISSIEKEIANLQTQLDEIPGALCNDPIKNLENFKAWFSIDVETDTPMLYESVYEEELINIGEGNLMDFIVQRGSNSGILISGSTGILPQFEHESTCDYDEICKSLRDEFVRQLYLTQYVNNYNTPQNNSQNAELLDLMGGWFDSNWINYTTTITDESIIQKIQNKKIRISIKVNTCCLDFGVLLDRIKIVQNCQKIDNIVIRKSKPIGFDLERIVDNKKSWVTSEVKDRRLFELPWRGTDYYINHYRLGVNTKEIDLSIDPAKAIEGDVYNYLLNNPCALECSSGTTLLEFETYVDFQTVLDNALADCKDCVSCYNQKQFENYECFDLMDGQSYEFQFQQVPTITYSGCDITVQWGITVELAGVLVYENVSFYSGDTTTSVPTQTQYLNELAYIANTLGLVFIYDGVNASFVNNYGCGDDDLYGDSFKIDLSLNIKTCDNKNFEDGDCFIFMDDDIFQFEDQ